MNRKHKWEKDGVVNWPGYLHCTECGAMASASCDPLDTHKISEFIEETQARTDCKGKK